MGSQGERLILGKLLTPAELGCFSVALMISSVPAAGISQLANQIFLPMISAAVRTSRADVVRDFVRMRMLFFGFALLSGIGFLTLAKPVIMLLLNSKYAMAGWMLQVLGLRVALDIFAAPASSVIFAYGQSKYSAGANATRVFFMIAGVWLAFALFGLREAVISLLIAQALSYFPLILGLNGICRRWLASNFNGTVFYLHR